MNYPAEQELTLRDLARIIQRSIPFILCVTALMVCLALVASFLLPRQYQAVATVHIQGQAQENLGMDVLRGTGASPQPASDALSADIEMQTQSAILQSNAMALRLIGELHLADTRDFLVKPPLFAWGEKAPVAAEGSPAAQDRLLRIFHKNFAVKPVSGTALIEISYLDSDPKLAATVVNGMVSLLEEQASTSGDNSSRIASQAMEHQLADLRTKSESLQAQVAQMQRQSGLYDIGTTDAQGHEQAYSAVLVQFQRAANNLSNADENRILKEGISQAAHAGNAEMLSSLAGNGAGSSSATTSFTTLQSLRTQQATMQGQLDQLRVKFGTGYPQVAELEANLAALNGAITQETQRVAQRADTDYEVAANTWQDAKRDFNTQKVKADALNDKAIQYAITRQEADATRSLYEDLLRRLKEAGILHSLRPSPIEVTDPALVPAYPTKPNKPLLVAAGAAGGLGLSVILSLVMYLVSDRLQDPEDLLHLGIPLVAIFPGRGRDLEGSGKLTYDTAVRSLRATLLRRPMGSEKLQVVLVVQTTPEQYTWQLPMDLARSFARQGRNILMVTADIHVAQEHSASGETGLISLLSSGGSGKDAFGTSSSEPNLSLLTAGETRGNLSDLLETGPTESLLNSWREQFDLTVIQGPPVLPLPDARVLAEAADITLLCAQLGVTTKTAVRRAHSFLKQHAKGEVLMVLDVGKTKDYDRFYGFPSKNVRFG